MSHSFNTDAHLPCFIRRIMDTQKKLNQRDDELKANREEMTSQKKLAEKLQAKLISVETDYEMKEKR